ncbi:MAG TPA: hypothetical protein VFQ77_21950 [Pseudonocardiaceae bacterium]|jgi:hypothetical protein|nr:hypothetical protein [Pseudonocardiaceae bacterium]
MNTNRPRRGFAVGGSIDRSVIGDNNSNITITSIGGSGSASLDDLRDAITLLRAEVDAASASVAVDSHIGYELQTIEDALDEDEPDGAVVRSRWKQVQKLLGPLQDVASIAQSATRVLALIGAFFGAS